MGRIDEFKKELNWQRELRENINKQKTKQKEALRKENNTKRNKRQTVGAAWEKVQKAKKSGIKNFGGNKSEMSTGLKVAAKPWGLLKQMGKSGDGVYFM